MLLQWQKEFAYISERKSYLLGVVASIIYGATLIDLSLVPADYQTLFIASRTGAGVLILLYLLGQYLLKFPVRVGYYLIFLAVMSISAFRLNSADTSNYLLLNGTCLIMFSILASMTTKEALLLSIYGVAVNIGTYLTLYTDTIPLNQAGLLVILALHIIFILVTKFRYDILKRNFLHNLLLQEQKEEIEQQRNNLLLMNEHVNQQKEEILAQRDAIEQKNETLENTLQNLAKKNNNITASITYAKRIQEAMLPSMQVFRRLLPESFVFYLPRDIVSGDFYWIVQKDGWTVVAAVDCTGHGVPGAFMSIAGEAMLRQIVEVQNVIRPDLILNELHVKVRKALRQGESQNRDGMDVAICAYHPQKNILQFAGAQNQLIYVKEGKLQRIRGDRQPIGGLQREAERVFNYHELEITTPTMCYLFSDGYQDQFGGAAGRKFMHHRFKDLLHRIHTLPFEEQAKKLGETLQLWMYEGGETQLDDILVIGFRLAPTVEK